MSFHHDSRWSELRKDNDDQSETDEEDLAELEALLYSQVHHQQEEDQDCSVTPYKGEIESHEEVDSGCGESRPNSSIHNQISPVKDGDSGSNSSNSNRIALVMEGGSRQNNRNSNLKSLAMGHECRNHNQASMVTNDESGLSSSLHLGSPDVRQEETEDSRYTSSTAKSSSTIQNPFFVPEDQSENDSDSSDDGIIILPKPKRDSPEVIDLDSNLEAPAVNSTIILSDDMDSDLDHTRALNISIESSSDNKKKNNKRKIKETLGKNNSYYKEAYGSDFEDNFCTDSDVEVIDSEVDESGLTLGNLIGSKSDDSKRRKISEIFSENLKISQKQSNISSFVPTTWTKEMDSFYNDVDESFLDLELDDIFSDMPDDTINWQIDRADVYGGGRQGRPRYFQGKRCHNCNQMGHLSRDCPEPEKVVRCSMCGLEGHREVRCPGRGCLRCGQPGFGYLESCSHCRRLNQVECKECRYLGHKASECPDLWRRFHLTTRFDRPSPVPVQAKHRTSSKPERNCWCCNCGQKGHSVDNCRQYIYSKYPVSCPRIVRYEAPKIQAMGTESKVNSDLTLSNKERRKELRDEAKKKKKMEKKLLRMNATCPNSPALDSPAMFMSEPASPRGRQGGFPTSLLVEKAIEKVGKLKRKSAKKLNKSTEQIISKTPKQNKGDIFTPKRIPPFKEKKARRLDALVSNIASNNSDLHQRRKREFQEERGFGKLNGTSKSSKGRASLIPTSVHAACKLLKKEIQSNSSNNRKLKKDLKQEIFGLKQLHGSPLLKKVERKRLADLVLQLRAAPS